MLRYGNVEMILANRIRKLGIFLLPALLVWLAGWPFMRSDYSGPHKSEWGYLAATVLGLILLVSYFYPEKPGERSKLSLFTVSAFTIALDV